MAPRCVHFAVGTSCNGCAAGGESVCSGALMLIQVCGLPIPPESENLHCCCSCFFDEGQTADSQAKPVTGNIICKKSCSKIQESHASIAGAGVLKNPAQALTWGSGNIREAREVSGFSIPITFCVLIS